MIDNGRPPGDGARRRIRDLLAFLYGPASAEGLADRMEDIAAAARLPARPSERDGGGPRPPTEKDALLIAYGDMLAPPEGGDGLSGLARLGGFLSRRGGDAFSYLHVLPFHPYTSDDGFSVVDYRRVDPRFGDWGDIAALARSRKLAFDFVVNHGSASSPWFRAFLRGEEPYRSWYLTRPAGYDASAVFRPRTHPLLTPFRLDDGSTANVWTTFSADQVDYDFSNPDVLLEFVRILLEFAEKGARIVRLDAIAYLWKEDGGPCLHHPKTHAVVKLFRAVVDALGLDLLILTETNVPHEQNVSYYGNGDEAHMVYNFALPPLVLHAALSADAGPLRSWASGLPKPGEGPLFLNFLASHDGVGLGPAKGLVDAAAFARTVAEAGKRGAMVSYKATPAGPEPYELNCSYLGVVAPEGSGSPRERARAFLSCQAVLLSLAGLPAVYFHSWIGSGPWTEGPTLLGYPRAINREKPAVDRAETELDDPSSLRAEVMAGFGRLLAFRGAEPAFAPSSPQRVVAADGAVFALLRGPDAAGRRVLCAQNLGASEAALETSALEGGAGGTRGRLELGPWETRWLAFGGGRADAGLSL